MLQRAGTGVKGHGYVPAPWTGMSRRARDEARMSPQPARGELRTGGVPEPADGSRAAGARSDPRTRRARVGGARTAAAHRACTSSGEDGGSDTRVPHRRAGATERRREHSHAREQGVCRQGGVRRGGSPTPRGGLRNDAVTALPAGCPRRRSAARWALVFRLRAAPPGRGGTARGALREHAEHDPSPHVDPGRGHPGRRRAGPVAGALRARARRGAGASSVRPAPGHAPRAAAGLDPAGGPLGRRSTGGLACLVSAVPGRPRRPPGPPSA